MTVKNRFGIPADFPGMQHPLMPYNVVGFVEDFRFCEVASATLTSGGWTDTHTGGGADTDTDVSLLEGIGGGIKLWVDAGTAADNDGINLVKDGGMFEADTDTDIIFECKFRIDGTHASINWLVGLCKPAETAFLAADAALADVRNAVFVCSADGFAQIDANSTRVAGVTDTRDTALGTLVDDTDIVLKIIISGRSKIEFFIDGELVSSSTVNNAIPDGTLTPIVAVLTAGTDEPEMEIKYVSCFQTVK